MKQGIIENLKKLAKEKREEMEALAKKLEKLMRNFKSEQLPSQDQQVVMFFFIDVAHRLST